MIAYRRINQQDWIHADRNQNYESGLGWENQDYHIYDCQDHEG